MMSLVCASYPVQAQSWKQDEGQSNLGARKVLVSDAGLSRDGNTLIVDYHIDFGAKVKACQVGARMYADGKKISGLKLRGDIGSITFPGDKQIFCDITSFSDRLEGKEVYFEVKPKTTEYLIMLDFALVDFESLTSGIMLGFVSKNRWGGYFKFSQQVSVGVMGSVARIVYPYVGLGANLMEDGSLTTDLGLVFRIGRFAASVGSSYDIDYGPCVDFGIGLFL